MEVSCFLNFYSLPSYFFYNYFLAWWVIPGSIWSVASSFYSIRFILQFSGLTLFYITLQNRNVIWHYRHDMGESVGNDWHVTQWSCLYDFYPLGKIFWGREDHWYICNTYSGIVFLDCGWFLMLQYLMVRILLMISYQHSFYRE